MQARRAPPASSDSSPEGSLVTTATHKLCEDFDDFVTKICYHMKFYHRLTYVSGMQNEHFEGKTPHHFWHKVDKMRACKTGVANREHPNRNTQLQDRVQQLEIVLQFCCYR